MSPSSLLKNCSEVCLPAAVLLSHQMAGVGWGRGRGIESEWSWGAGGGEAGRKSRSPTLALSLIGPKVCVPNQLSSLLSPGNLRNRRCKSVSQKPPTSPLISCCRLIQPPWQLRWCSTGKTKWYRTSQCSVPATSCTTSEAPTTLLEPTKFCPSQGGKAHVLAPPYPILPNTAKVREKIC